MISDKDKERSSSSSSSSKHRDSSSSSSSRHKDKDKEKDKKSKLSLPGPEPLPPTQPTNDVSVIVDGDPLGGTYNNSDNRSDIEESNSMSQYKEDEPKFMQMDIETIKAGGVKTEYSDEDIKKEVSEEEEDIKPVKIEEESDEDLPLVRTAQWIMKK